MKPFKRGMEAFRTGALGNPYNVDTQRHRDWELGFNKAYFAQLKRVQKREKNSKHYRSGKGGGRVRQEQEA